jgi:hypothetical protein
MIVKFHHLALGLGTVVLSLISHSFAQNCSGTSVGFKPLAELASATYKGYTGGLFPGGKNERPWTHDSAGRALAQQIKPLNQSGLVDLANGKIVLLSIGMSNTTQEFSVFKHLADSDGAKNQRLTIVDGAQGGQTAAIIANPNASFWTVVDQRLTAGGVSSQQVQIVWLKEADATPSQAFPTHALALENELVTIAQILKSRYPNIKLTYVSSRTYGGYATSTLNPEPYAYESGFSVKWLIEKQINGDTSLMYSGSKAKSPWLSWGPYLWVDGLTPRTDGLTWQCSDCQSDGTHPSPTGQTKIANLLLSFFKSDPTANSWFLKSATTSVEAVGENLPPRVRLEQNYPNPFNPNTAIRFQLLAPSEAEKSAFSFVTLRIFDVLGKEVATLVNDMRVAGTYTVQWDASKMPSGVYFCRLQTGAAVQTGKMLLAK